jgi:hypothetical protein
MSMWDAQPSQRHPRLFVPPHPKRAPGFVLDAAARAREPGGGGQQKLVLDLSRSRHQRQLQLFLVQPVLSNGPGPRRLLPTQSVSGHAFRDRLHLVRSDALELRRVRRR